MTYRDKIRELARAAADDGRAPDAVERALDRLSDAWAGAQKAEMLSWVKPEPGDEADFGAEALSAIEDLNGICDGLGLGPFADADGADAALVVAHAVASEGYAAGRGAMPRHGGRDRSPESRSLQERGVEAAARYLELTGFEVLELNWSCPAGGIDVIARDGGTLVFADVVTRTRIEKGFPGGDVGEGERSRLEKVAMWYLRDYEEVDIPVRFDTVALVVVAEDRALVRHYVNALADAA